MKKNYLKLSMLCLGFALSTTNLSAQQDSVFHCLDFKDAAVNADKSGIKPEFYSFGPVSLYRTASEWGPMLNQMSASDKDITFFGRMKIIVNNSCDNQKLTLSRNAINEIIIENDTILMDELPFSNNRYSITSNQNRIEIVGVVPFLMIGNSTNSLDYFCMEYESCLQTSTTSIEASKLNIFPNPTTNGMVNVNLEGAQYSFNVFNITGELVSTKSDVFGVQNVDLSKEPKGVYFVQIFNENFTETRKVIVK